MRMGQPWWHTHASVGEWRGNPKSEHSPRFRSDSLFRIVNAHRHQMPPRSQSIPLRHEYKPIPPHPPGANRSPPPPPSSPLHRAPSPPSLSTVSFLYPFLISSIPLESLSSSWPLPSLSRSHPIQTILTIQCTRPIMAPLIPILTVRWWSHLNLGGIPVPSKLVTTLAALLLNSLVH